jgi:hypothetical protein
MANKKTHISITPRDTVTPGYRTRAVTAPAPVERVHGVGEVTVEAGRPIAPYRRGEIYNKPVKPRPLGRGGCQNGN